MLNGVVSVDPDHLAEPQHPPILSIRSIVADGREIDASATLPSDTHTAAANVPELPQTR